MQILMNPCDIGVVPKKIRSRAEKHKHSMSMNNLGTFNKVFANSKIIVGQDQMQDLLEKRLSRSNIKRNDSAEMRNLFDTGFGIEDSSKSPGLRQKKGLQGNRKMKVKNSIVGVQKITIDLIGKNPVLKEKSIAKAVNLIMHPAFLNNKHEKMGMTDPFEPTTQRKHFRQLTSKI
jgi:hypothetical protein